MRFKLGRPSPAMAVALLALFLAVGGNVVAYGLGRNSVHSRDIAPGAVPNPGPVPNDDAPSLVVNCRPRL